MSIATPRPAVMSTSVAMMGWIPRTETRNPFHTPRTKDSASAIPTATRTVVRLSGVGDDAMKLSATAPEIATTAPTDRSMPRVAMTRVMPSATTSSGSPFFSRLTSDPKRCPSCSRMDRKLGRLTVLTASSTTSATIGQKSRCWTARCQAGAVVLMTPALRSR